MDLEHEKRLADVENRAKSNSTRLDKLEEDHETLNRLATAVEVMATKQGVINENVTKLTSKVDSLEAAPGKMWKMLVEKVIYIVVAAILGFVFARVGLG